MRELSSYEKFCAKCNTIKLRSDFSKSRCRYDGLQSQCKRCMYKNLKRWLPKNRDKAVNYNKKWRERNPEKYKEKADKYNRKRLRKPRDTLVLTKSGNVDKRYKYIDNPL